MKKTIYALFFLCLLVLPLKVRAAKIDDLNIVGNETAKSGEQVVITLRASTSGYDTNEGIWLVYMGLTYDTSYLALTKITSPGYYTIVQYEDDGSLFVSEAIENSGVSGMCVNGLLNCGTYTLTLTFQVINVTTLINASIATSEFGIGTLNITEERDYTLDDVIETTYPNQVTHSLLIEPKTTQVEEKPPIIVPEESQNNEITKKPETITTTFKSGNNYLESLEITNYNLDFNKYTTTYTTSIDSTVTSLDIKPVVEQGKASYKITGNENLEDGSVIKIMVTAEDGETKEYNINIEKEKAITAENKNEKIIVDKTDKPKESFFIANKKIIIVISGIVGLLVIIGLIFIINNIRENRKFDKLLGDD